MGRLERYIFMTVGSAFLALLAVLTSMIWLTQALRRFDLITSQGQTLWVFLVVTGLSLPTLVLITAPIAFFIAIVYTLNKLNSDSELIVMSASGVNQWQMFRPFLILSLAISAISTFISTDLSPRSLLGLREQLTAVNTDIVTNVAIPGRFTSVERGLTFHVRERGPNGALFGIFMYDARDPAQVTTYIADRGRVAKSDTGTFLVLEEGSLQRSSGSAQQKPANKDEPAARPKKIKGDDASSRPVKAKNEDAAARRAAKEKSSQQISNASKSGNSAKDSDAQRGASIVEFERYAFDLSQIGTVAANIQNRPATRNMSELLWPEPDDPVYKTDPGRFRVEIHKRLSTPLYPIAVAVIAFAFLGAPRTTRQSRGLAIGGAATVFLALEVAGLGSGAFVQRSPLFSAVPYVAPLAAILIGLLSIGGFIEARVPAFLQRFAETMVARLDRLQTA